MCSSGPNHIDIFYRGTDDSLKYVTWDGISMYSAEKDLGGKMRSSPTCTSSSPGRIDYFYRGADDAMWQGSFDGI